LQHFWPLQQDVPSQQSAANKLVPKTNIKVTAVKTEVILFMGILLN